MFGLHLFYIELSTLELLLRRIYGSITHSFETGKIQIKRVQDIEPAFTEQEFNEAIKLTKKEDLRLNKLHLSISDQQMKKKQSHININRNGSNVVIGNNESADKLAKNTDQDQEMNEEDDEANQSEDQRELFSGLLGDGEEGILEKQARKKEEKKKLVEKLTSKKSRIRPFVYSTNLIK